MDIYLKRLPDPASSKLIAFYVDCRNFSRSLWTAVGGCWFTLRRKRRRSI